MKSLKALNQILTMSSLEIAELTGKRHDNVMADIRKMLNELDINATEFSGTFKAGKNNTYECFKLPKRETLILIGGYNVALRAAIIDRWQELENEVAALKAQKAAVAQQRQALKVEYRPMTDAIKNAVAARHSEPMPHHFSNEADMINRIILGCPAKKYRLEQGIGENESLRDYLTPLEMKCFLELQRANTVYITDELEYEERKEKLIAAYNKRWREQLINEHMMLEA